MAPRHHPSPPSNAALVAELKARIRAIEGITPTTQVGARVEEGVEEEEAGGGPGTLAFGIAGIDAALAGGGLRLGALHEVSGDSGAATGFSAALLGRLLKHREGLAVAVLWCRTGHPLYPPGLAALGVPPEKLVVIEARRDGDVLWAMEEGLRSRALAAVVGEARQVSLTASRRLELAAEKGGVTAFLLAPRTDKSAPSAAVTRWRIEGAPGAADGGLSRPCWRVALIRCRGGGMGEWTMEWRNETGDFAVVAEAGARSAVPRVSRLAG